MPTLSHDGRWVHIHCRKTGGLWVQTALLELGGQHIPPRHMSYRRFLADQPHIAQGAPFGTVRDPWTWHVSNYLWTYGGAASLEGFDYYLRTAAGWCWHSHRAVYEGVRVFIPTDRLWEGLHAVLGEEPPPLERVNTAHERTGLVFSYRDWYTPELVQLVWEKEARHIEMFGFEPFKPTPWAVRGM